MKLKYKKLYEDAKAPLYNLPGDAGCDLFACDEVVLNPGQIHRIYTGLAVEIPDGYVGLFWDKSGISTKYGIKILGGVIDSGYRGELIITMINLGHLVYSFKKGDKVAQMLLQKVERPDLEEVKELSGSERGENGFGSTGK